MHYQLLSDNDMKQMDNLIESYGGAAAINQKIADNRDYETRKKVAQEKGYGDLLEKAEAYSKDFAKFDDYVKANNIEFTKPAVATTQVSGFQGAPITLQTMKRLAEDKKTIVPTEMIAVMALDEDYVYNGELTTTLAMCENIMGCSRYVNTNLVGIPFPNSRFEHIEKVTGEKFFKNDNGDGTSNLIMANMGTFFGNFGGIEVSNNNHLVYLDNIARCAMETGGNWYLNPSWSTIITGCYFAREIRNIQFKISMLLSTQNCMQFRMLLNIMKSYLREDGTSPIAEINIGNGATPETFIQCDKELKDSGIKGVSLTAHLRINPDLGRVDFNWFDNAVKVLESGTDITIKYESDGESRPYDTMEAYFLPKPDRLEHAVEIGDVLYHKCVRCDADAKAIMQKGFKAVYADIAY